MAALPDFPLPAPAPAPAFDAGAFDFASDPPPALGDERSAELATQPQPAVGKGTCKSCGKVISDAFDIALGSCDDCRSKQHEIINGPTPDTNPGKSERVDIAAIAAARSAPNLPPVPSAVPAPAAPPVHVALPPSTAVRSAGRVQEGDSKARFILTVVGAVVLVGIVICVLAWKRPWVRKPPKVTTVTGGASSKPIDEIVKKWKLNYPELGDEDSGEARGHVIKGEEFLALDTTPGYRDAIEEFEKAMVLDSSSDRALTGWVLAVAFGRGGDIDELTSAAADSLLIAAEQRSGNPALYAAHAHLDIARGVNVNDVQHRAEIGKNSKEPRDKALAMLALGQAQLQKNAQNAEQLFNEALTLDPKLRRAYLFQAQLAISLGRYKQAVDALEKRLSLDADQWEASESLARVSVEIGDVAKAKKVLEDAKAASTRNVRPRITLAMLAYQHQGDFPAALELLNGVVNDGDVSKKDRADALVHLSAIARIEGDAVKAMEHADQAVELQPDHVPARVQQMLAAIDKGVASQARLTMDSLKGKLPASLETLLEGRLFFLENRLPEALSSLAGLGERDQSQTGAIFLAGAAAAKLRKDGRAWEQCLKRGLKVDPLSSPVPALTHLYVRPADLLKPAVGAWASLVSGGEEDPNPFLCEGMVAWHSDDLATAEKAFARVTNIDPRSADGFAMRSFAALRKKDVGTAVAHGQRAVAASKAHGLARAALAMALLAANKVDLAKIEANEANRLAPLLLSPRVVIGDAEARQKHPEEARKRLTGVLLADPTYREAKRVLFKQGL
jgi:tetratricopeptide (TPR) repeat protein